MSQEPVTVVWFRRDLRLEDNPALQAAIERGGPVVPLYIWAPDEAGDRVTGAASRWWLHHALFDLDDQLRERGLRLILQTGESLEAIRTTVRKTGADAVYWNRRYEPFAIARDWKIKQALRSESIDVRSFNASLLFEPWEIANKSGKPFQVFTPFWKNASARSFPRPVAVDRSSLRAPENLPDGVALADYGLLPRIRWDKKLESYWRPTYLAGRKRLADFLREAVSGYGQNRDRPDISGTSRLSPYLHFGQIGPRQIVEKAGGESAVRGGGGLGKFLAEVGWREFGYHLLYHFPHTPDSPLREQFQHFPWREDPASLRAWQRGHTGYPMVDAAMRELWETGWMHNRCRMIVGSFLVKHLLLSWQEGEKWFWDTLVDADLASNTLGWQWAGGCGADAAPYFRVFNPIIQGKKFDPQGHYVRRYVPEIAKLPDDYLHAPWEAPANVLREAKINLGETYPEPIIDHKTGRNRALQAFEKLQAMRS